ncbi:argininosuccinate lyase [Sutcliffiella horikoshii]|uniref:argininosuccinate lyase n=1 Tax=Sutcliffiella horikoshii TaxID=79883 RepID=A0A5D4SR33_9BACI|nr:lyase family protein [Sutcliffiella horikoshii]TYS65780.1 argininosuccinate lyase [Sutcliffiella horikoshii]
MEEQITGRISSVPDRLLHEEILEPQFRYELDHLFQGYIQIEHVMLLEYIRMGWISEKEGKDIIKQLQLISPATLVANPQKNMSDIAFAIERTVDSSLSNPVPCWHLDRSRNDFQACAQLIFGRQEWLLIMKDFIELINSMHSVAIQYKEMLMPGYTHYQTAQVITPGFYLSTINEEFIQSLSRWIRVYDDINQCPLGSGAMAGVELDWDRDNLARLLGFNKPRKSALGAVASREWALQMSSELSIFSVLISRFVTDLIQWGSIEMNFIDLPDNLSGISSAMPQKKNFPILERIRGKSAHLASFHFDMVLGQRNTPFTNLVETSKEAGTHLFTLFVTTKSLIRLLRTVVEHLTFNKEQMLRICERDFFGGFTLANLLTIKKGIPYRKAQVIVGRFIKSAYEQKLLPREVNAQLLEEKCSEEGFMVGDISDLLKVVFNARENLNSKKSVGSTNPVQVNKLLLRQKEEIKRLTEEIEKREDELQDAEELRVNLLNNI